VCVCVCVCVYVCVCMCVCEYVCLCLCVCMCVCVYMSLSVIRCNDHPLHLRSVSVRGQTKKERKKDIHSVKNSHDVMQICGSFSYKILCNINLSVWTWYILKLCSFK